MKNSKIALLALVALFSTACATTGVPVTVTMETHGGQRVPVFTWEACTKATLQECGDEYAVTGLIVMVDQSCTFIPKETGSLTRAFLKGKDITDPRRQLWFIGAKEAFHTIQPPIVYGQLPEGAQQLHPGDDLPPPMIPDECRYAGAVAVGNQLADAVQANLDQMTGGDVWAKTDAVGTHTVQPLAGTQKCYFGQSELVMQGSGVKVPVTTLQRRAIDGNTIIEDNVTLNPTAPPVRTVYKYTAADDGTFTLEQVGGTATATGTYVAGEGDWASWKLEMTFAGSGTMTGEVQLSDASSVSKGAMATTEGKTTMTYSGTLKAITAEECEKNFSRIPPFEGL